MAYRNPRTGRDFSPVEGKLYNLKTSRSLVDSEKNRKTYQVHETKEGFLIAYTEKKELDEFVAANRKEAPTLAEMIQKRVEKIVEKALHKEPPSKREEKKDEPVKVETKHEKKSDETPGKKPRRVTFESEAVKAAEKSCWVPRSTDVADIPAAALQGLSRFNLIGFRGKARVARIIDGDTADFVIYIPPEFINRFRQVGRAAATRPTICFPEQKGFFTMLDFRLYGVDTAEADTAQGLAAIALTEKTFEEKKNIVWVEIWEAEKYGRLLVNVYLDPGYTILWNEVLVNHRDSRLGVIAEAYFGGTKSEYLKNLPKTQKKTHREAIQ